MIANLVRFALRFKRVRAEAMKCLAYYISQKREADRREEGSVEEVSLQVQVRL